MKKKNSKSVSLAERLVKLITKQSKSAEELRDELKDRFGYKEKHEHIRVNLLYLLRREKIKRVRTGKLYKYHI